jgi:hypothetical protein
MHKLLLLTAGAAVLGSAAAMLTLRAEATMLAAPATLQAAAAEATLVDQARMACTHRRVCRQGAGCAWRKVCKRW